MTLRALLACALLFSLGCDDGGGTDAGATSDGGSSGTDGGAPGADAGPPAGDAGPEVGRCQASSAALAAACPDDGRRTCHAGAYAAYCLPESRSERLADALDCLLAMSGASGCRTFSDPSGADACVDMAFDGLTDDDVAAIVGRISVLCGDDSIHPNRTEPPLWVLTPTQLSTMRACVEAAADCDATASCAEGIQEPIAVCYR